MFNDQHDVPMHTDDTDISHQYVFHLGSWVGASLVCFDSDQKDVVKEIASFSEVRRVALLEGRHLHYIRKEKFVGVRYTAIVYKSHGECARTTKIRVHDDVYFASTLARLMKTENRCVFPFLYFFVIGVVCHKTRFLLNNNITSC